MKKKAKRIARIMGNASLDVVAQMIVDEAKGVRYDVYADGSCKDCHCGCGWLILHNGAIIKSGKFSFSYHKNDSVMAELRAVILALGDCPSSCSVDVYVDCQAAIRKIEEKRLEELLTSYNNVSNGKVIRYHWVKAHYGNIYNEMADSLAYNAIKS